MKKTLTKIIEKINDLPVAKRQIRQIAKNPSVAYYYAYHVIGGRFPEAEPTIAKDPTWAYGYARSVLKKPRSEAGIYEL